MCRLKDYEVPPGCAFYAEMRYLIMSHNARLGNESSTHPREKKVAATAVSKISSFSEAKRR